jgi:ketosteroid isomerase-like protein
VQGSPQSNPPDNHYEEITMTTAQQTDAQIMQAAYDAFAAGDIPGVLALMHEDATWHIPGTSLVAGDYRGHEEIGGFFMKIAELSAGTIKADLHELFDNGSGTVVALATLSGTTHGQAGSFETVEIWRLAGGKIMSYTEHYGDEAAMNAFWS